MYCSWKLDELNQLPNFPKLTRDEKRCTKLTTNDVIQIRLDYEKNPNYKIFAEKYNVSRGAIRNVVDDEFRQKQIKYCTARRKERMKDPNYRKHIYSLQTESRKTRLNKDKTLSYSNHKGLVKNMSITRHINKNISAKKYRDNHPEQTKKGKEYKNMVSRQIKRSKNLSGFRMFFESLEFPNGSLTSKCKERKHIRCKGRTNFGKCVCKCHIEDD